MSCLLGALVHPLLRQYVLVAINGILLAWTQWRIQGGPGTLTSNHLPHPHHESPWGDEKLSDTLTAEAGRKWKKLNFEIFSITSRKSYCISKIIIFATVPRWLTCDYSPKNNTMSHLLPAVIWWPSSRCICRCLLIGGKLNSIKFLWRYLMSWIKVNDTYLCAMLICGTIWILRTSTTQKQNLFQFFVCCAAEV